MKLKWNLASWICDKIASITTDVTGIKWYSLDDRKLVVFKCVILDPGREGERKGKKCLGQMESYVESTLIDTVNRCQLFIVIFSCMCLFASSSSSCLQRHTTRLETHLGGSLGAWSDYTNIHSCLCVVDKFCHYAAHHAGCYIKVLKNRASI